MREKTVSTQECLGPAFKFHLSILIEVCPIIGDTGIQYWVELVTRCIVQEQCHQALDLCVCIHLRGIKFALEIVQLIGVGLVGAKAAESVGRNPGASGKILVQAIIGMALAEAVAFYALFL